MAWATSCLLAATISVAADDPAAARFRGTGKADPIRITNVQRTPCPGVGQSTITFDLAWDHSWRAAWEVEEKQHGGKGPLRLESWDAAWVFAKYRTDAAAGHAHAMLSPTAADHGVPAGAALEVGRSDDGKQGVGVFVCRAAAGSGANDFKGGRLRCVHGADVPADADLRVFAVQMVRVPECGFWAGDGSTDFVRGQFSSGTTSEPVRIESEGATTLGVEAAGVVNNRDGAGMNLSNTDDFNSDVPVSLPAAFPKGYRAFSCMRQEMTQQQYVDFLNTLSFDRQAQRTIPQGEKRLGPDAPAGTAVLVGEKNAGGSRAAVRIAVSGVADVREPVTVDRKTFIASARWSNAAGRLRDRHSARRLQRHQSHRRDRRRGLGRTAADDGTRIREGLSRSGPARAGGIRLGDRRDRRRRSRRRRLRAAGCGHGGGDGRLGRARRAGRGSWQCSLLAANRKLGGPLRGGVFATATSDRVSAGASYWGILELSGNVNEMTVPVGVPQGRAFAGTYGSGGAVPWDLFCGLRGGGYGDGGGHYKGFGGDDLFRVSNRFMTATPGVYNGARHFMNGFRGVRTAPAADAR